MTNESLIRCRGITYKRLVGLRGVANFLPDGGKIHTLEGQEKDKKKKFTRLVRSGEAQEQGKK